MKHIVIQRGFLFCTKYNSNDCFYHKMFMLATMYLLFYNLGLSDRRTVGISNNCRVIEPSDYRSDPV